MRRHIPSPNKDACEVCGATGRDILRGVAPRTCSGTAATTDILTASAVLHMSDDEFDAMMAKPMPIVWVGADHARTLKHDASALALVGEKRWPGRLVTVSRASRSLLDRK